MTLIYELDPYTAEIHRMCKTSYIKAFESYRMIDIHTYIGLQTDRQTERHDQNFAGDKKRTQLYFVYSPITTTTALMLTTSDTRLSCHALGLRSCFVCSIRVRLKSVLLLSGFMDIYKQPVE